MSLRVGGSSGGGGPGVPIPMIVSRRIVNL